MDTIMASAGLARSGNPRPMDGKVAVVTGSTSGIGLGIANALAAAGAMIVLNGIAEPIEAENLCQVLGARHDVPVRFDGADMSKPAAIRDMVERVGRSFGAVDILVNNAGIQLVAPIEEFPPEKWDAIQAINLSAAFHAIRVVLPEMKRRGFGRIVNIASAHGLIGSPFKSAYVAAKHGIVGLTKVVALEAAEHGVTCNAVCPGYVWTPLVEKQVDGQAKAHGISRDAVIRDVFLAEQPTKRFVTVDEVAGTVAFLCGEAAGSITGIALPIDGGWTAH
jgi:3-hydroxybutyrate dehydrogenase